ncbi:flavodoxin domain-containing protein [Sporosalibacterium faouarense]|uniref:flavodoxin domain-containing protein n=1 Tax=Sporosalibacterium faouarense TaxID=516123 RepID=UPI00141C17D0|nr:flavodoxin domain-containing protein [Sporosalibacterium faouarense]MTI47074.1 flavodoxin [Bacillota bacterium]
MKILIAYGTKHGCTEECAKKLSEILDYEVDLINLSEHKNIDLSIYNKIIFGSSVYIGKIHKEVKEFCNKNLNILKDKKIGLFTCGMSDRDVAVTQLKDSYPKVLVDNAVAKGFFGGEFIFKKLNFMERFIVKKVSKVEKDTSNISEEEISRFAKEINKC